MAPLIIKALAGKNLFDHYDYLNVKCEIKKNKTIMYAKRHTILSKGKAAWQVKLDEG